VLEALSGRVRWFVARRERVLAAAIALLAGATVFWLAAEIFPYHSSNHDEGVYLQQAELLLGGQLQFHAGPISDAVRPWFFVDTGDRLYPKYQPLPAGIFAAAIALFGEPRVTLAAVAAGNTALVYVLGSMAFDRQVGVVAAVSFATAPMTLLTSAVFLAYAPTTLFNLAFAVLYLRAARTRSPPTAALAGGAIGVAFFMRPFTAVLFAVPFLAHAAWELGGIVRDSKAESRLRSALTTIQVRRQASTAIVGLAFVALALGYNAYITGDPLVFPYEAFAPQDGPGFGYREILDHSLQYTPAVALEANGYVLWYLVTRWVFAGALGAALAAVGLVAAARRDELSGDTLPQRLLAGLFVSVPVGNLFFWGNYNLLATMSDPTDGLIAQFGPFYHFDLLAPLAIFAAAGGVALWRAGRPRVEALAPNPGLGRAVAVTALVVAVLVLAGANAAVVAEPLERNAAQTDTYEQAYEPFESQEFENAVVFLPTPYGDWLNHPFQYLRNDPGLDGPAVYALDRHPESDFRVIDAYPDRSLYRYDFRGEWTANPENRLAIPKLEALSVRSGEDITAETVVGIPDRVSHATVRVETDEGDLTRHVEDPDDRLTVGWSLDSERLSVDSIGGNATVDGSVALTDTEEVVVLVRLSQPGAGTLTYRQEATVRTTGQEVDVIWPPKRTVCPHVDDCGQEGTFIPDETRAGVVFETRVVGR
jgi:hypothetical protein